jgi:hypothetical protein
MAGDTGLRSRKTSHRCWHWGLVGQNELLDVDKVNRHAETQGSTIEISRSAKCRRFRVANVA